ncbi:MAG TPA: preprotein translocase subunit SecE [Gaiella sp.]
MARETRRQRREARRASGAEQAPVSLPRGAEGGAAVAPTPPLATEPRRRGGFIRESWAELNKVEWPNRAQVIQGTVVVLIACAIVGAFLWGADQVLRPFVRDVLLG